jgi:hypothetical protein
MQVYKVREHQLPPEVHSKLAELEFESEKYKYAIEKNNRILHILHLFNLILSAANTGWGIGEIVKGHPGRATFHLVLAAGMVYIVIQHYKQERKKKQDGSAQL